MKGISSKLRRGDLVEVCSPDEILATLDSNGTLDGLPFMPEMLEFCGNRLRVQRRAEQVCTDGAPVPPGESRVRSFVGHDVVLLEHSRCSGLQHDGCKRGCMIFWKEAWLRKVERSTAVSPVLSEGRMKHHPRLKTDVQPGFQFCQSSELLKTTYSLSGGQRLRNCFQNLVARNYGPLEMAGILLVWLYSRARLRLFGQWPCGKCATTPVESLDLQPGEWVEVKSLEAIRGTLDVDGKNRGLHFSADMSVYCGHRFRVRCRTDKLIAEGTGKMRQLRNTVILEDAVCDSSYYAFGGCPRRDFMYWREIWLKRV